MNLRQLKEAIENIKKTLEFMERERRSLEAGELTKEKDTVCAECGGREFLADATKEFRGQIPWDDEEQNATFNEDDLDVTDLSTDSEFHISLRGLECTACSAIVPDNKIGARVREALWDV